MGFEDCVILGQAKGGADADKILKVKVTELG